MPPPNLLITDRNGRTTNRYYDFLNRSNLEFWSTSGIENRRFTTTFDAIGNTTATIDNTSRAS